ncbi:MAG: 2-keto-4-pentenoate hydratase [Actinobacteria bacterium]|nr:2-keto-4-pentenoate hydratase [Actinomycetota bacterium]
MTSILGLANELDRAAASFTSFEAFTEEFSVDEAYAVQDEYLAIRSKRTGSPKIGYKVALTSPGAQNALKSTQPAYGQLLKSDVEASGVKISISKHFAPLLETELIFKITDDLSHDASLDEIASKSVVAAGIECPESRFLRWFGGAFPALTLRHVIADNCLAGFVVTSDHWVDSTTLDFPNLTCELFVNSTLVVVGSGAEVLGNPMKAIKWLNETLVKKGAGLKFGDVISSGTFTGPVIGSAGKVTAQFSGGIGNAFFTFEQ